MHLRIAWTATNLTGASSEIGLELAKCFARDDYDVILVAEDHGGLDAAAAGMRGLGAGSVETIVADLTDLEAARQVYETVERSGRDLDPASPRSCPERPGSPSWVRDDDRAGKGSHSEHERLATPVKV
jgi:hypothetical protein